MINSNPRRCRPISTFRTSSNFEPLTLENVLEIVRWERPRGVVVQLGGQTPLRLTKPLDGGRRADPRDAAGLHRHRGDASGSKPWPTASA